MSGVRFDQRAARYFAMRPDAAALALLAAASADGEGRFAYSVNELVASLGWSRKRVMDALDELDSSGCFVVTKSQSRYQPSTITLVGSGVRIDGGSQTARRKTAFVGIGGGKEKERGEESKRPKEIEEKISATASMFVGHLRKHGVPNPSEREAKNALFRLLDVDGLQVDEIQRVVEWLVKSDSREAAFWRGVIVDGRGLRRHWPRLAIQSRTRAGSKTASMSSFDEF